MDYKLVDNEWVSKNKHPKETRQETMDKYFPEGFGTALISSKNS